MTTVINLFGGPGIGKSTTAAGLFYEMKLNGYDVELVREYAKTFAYHNSMPDQTYLFAKQLKAESLLYGKVDFIITDSPLWLCAYYEYKLANSTYLTPLIKGQEDRKKDFNIFLKRYKPFRQNGRLQSEEEARKIDEELDTFLLKECVPFVTVADTDRHRVSTILGLLTHPK